MELLSPLPELEIYILAIAFGIRAVMVLDQELAPLKDKEETVLRVVLANAARVVNQSSIGTSSSRGLVSNSDFNRLATARARSIPSSTP